MMIRRLLVGLPLVGVVICLIIFLLFRQWLFSPLFQDKDLSIIASESLFVVKEGETLSSISRTLEANGYIDSRIPLVALARIYGLDKVKAGEYQLSEDVTPLGFLQTLNHGDSVQRQITFIEGSTASEAIGLVAENDILESRFSAMTEAQQFEALSISELHLEGWIFPDTYSYIRGDSDLAVLARAVARMRQVLDEEWQRRREGLPISSPYEALILASIVEKETGVPEERQEIAGVFIRRLEKNMRLQTDPTVIYGLGDKYQGNITRKHLKEYTPYNTYRINGLPPTPIALPGREAIHAVLNPAEGESLYFVAKGDGSHHFSRTLEEHQTAVRKYQLSRKPDYRSSPQQKAN